MLNVECFLAKRPEQTLNTQHSILNIQVRFNGLILNAQLLEPVHADLFRSQLTCIGLIGIHQHIFNMNQSLMPLSFIRHLKVDH